MRRCRDFTIFQNSRSFIRPKENSTFKIHDINGIKVLNRLGIHSSHLNELKFRHNFRAIIDPMCSYGLEPETTLYYLLRCNLSSDHGTEVLNDICALNPTLKNLSDEKLLNIFLYGSENFSFNTNKKIIKSTIRFLKISERFIGPWINESLFEDYMYITMQHVNASVLWLVLVLSPVLCSFYSFVVL